MLALIAIAPHRVNVVAFDFLGHGDSPSPNQPELYTIDEVCSVIIIIHTHHFNIVS